MATQISGAASNIQLCDYCHQKPKFANHSFCSKTCAGQAAALCDYCHKKPKFQGFEYCGKNCAAQANAAGKGARNAATTSQPVPNVGATTFGKGRNNVNQQQQQPTTAAPFDPVQMAKLVAQHIPQVAQAFLSSNGAQQGPVGGIPPTSNPSMSGPTPQVMPSRINTVTNPFLGGIPATQQNLNNGNNKQTADDLRCLIPGCGKPVHVDAKGVKTSDYCSLRHREESVTSGLRSPCILCLAYPQSDADYFCSRACREESMNKYLEYDDFGPDDEETLVSEPESTATYGSTVVR